METVKFNDGTVGIISYTSKSLTQFFGCSDIDMLIEDKTPIQTNTYAYGKVNGEEIKVRVTSVLNSINIRMFLYWMVII